MNSADFADQYEQYLDAARAAQRDDLHHDQRRELFLNFLGGAFGIDLAQVEREQYIQLHGQQVKTEGTARIRKGWIDAIFRDLIFEFKRDLKRELADGLRELRDYLSNIADGDRCVGLLTDGLKFTAYVLDATEPNGLREVDALDLERTAAEAAHSWLDAYLLRQRSVSPTSADIVSRFGLRSPTFATAGHILRDALAVFSGTEAGAAEVKRQQWAFYLARVYGSADASNDEMFVRHTYLCQFAKILAYAAYFSAGEAASNVEDILSGRGFEVLGISNVGEDDFFAWALAPEVKGQTLAAFAQIAASLAVYDLSKINEDLLKQLYQNLVEPETRHELGEFYTPDWLAELTLRQIGYGPGKSLLDPACGSGTFLFTALRLLAEQGTTGETLVDFALENVMGMDVHPLAVTIARINYMLAIVPHLRQSRQREQRPVPIFMANSLQRASKAGPVGVITVHFDAQRSFQIPQDAASRPGELLYVLGEMQRRAQHEARNWPSISTGKFGQFAAEHLAARGEWGERGFIEAAWNTNLTYLAEQIAKGRDSIWVYVMRNTSQPQILQHRKFDVVAGNPPWIAYRYLKDASYRNDVKELTREYGLLETGDVKLNTQMELSTLFFEHCSHVYLKAGGTIAFVMPRSVMTGAKQHQAFQRTGFSRVLDLKGVAPLFNVETCVMIRQPGALLTSGIPSKRYSGKLPAHECRWSEAGRLLTESDATVDFAAESEVASPYYHPRFKQGATLVPRNLVFVTSAQPGLAPGDLAHSTIMKTDPDVDAEAKAPWKGLALQGHIDDAFLYATLLSKNLVPFGIRRLHLVALPVRVDYPQQLAKTPGERSEKRFIPMSLAEMRDSITYSRSADDWFSRAEQIWAEHKTPTTKETLAEWVNYQGKLSGQSAEPGNLVIYGASGSNISASLVETGNLPIVSGVHPQALAIDYTTFWYQSESLEEGHYLTAILNAPCVDAAIKPYQPRGIYVGPRHIQRRPFEVCPIPEFDANNDDHRRLAALSRAAHQAVAALDLREGGVVAARKKAREAARGYLDEIDAIARRMLGLATLSPGPSPTRGGEPEADEDEEDADMAE